MAATVAAACTQYELIVNALTRTAWRTAEYKVNSTSTSMQRYGNEKEWMAGRLRSVRYPSTMQQLRLDEVLLQDVYRVPKIAPNDWHRSAVMACMLRIKYES